MRPGWTALLVAFNKVLGFVVYLILVFVSFFSGLIGSLWVMASTIPLMTTFWGPQVACLLIMYTVISFITLLFLISMPVRGQAMRNRPTTLMQYAIIAWVSVSTCVLIESVAMNSEQRVRWAYDRLIGDINGASAVTFMEAQKCRVDSDPNCWRQVETFVKTHFCRFAEIFTVMYPIIAGFAIVYLIII